jgi:hypothetical protein
VKLWDYTVPSLSSYNYEDMPIKICFYSLRRIFERPRMGTRGKEDNKGDPHAAKVSSPPSARLPVSPPPMAS